MRKILSFLLSTHLFAATPIFDVSAFTQWYSKAIPGEDPALAVQDVRAYLNEKGNPDVLRDTRGRPLQPDALAARYNETLSVDTVISLLRQCPTADEKIALVELNLVRRVLFAEIKTYVDDLENTVDVYADQIAANSQAILNTAALQQLLLDTQTALVDANDSLARAGFSAADIQQRTATLNRVIIQLRGLLGV